MPKKNLLTSCNPFTHSAIYEHRYMRALKSYFPFLLGAILLLLVTNNAHAQSCKVTVLDSMHGCAPYSLRFKVKATYTKPIIGYNWDFKDGSNSQDSLPVKIYTKRGTYKPCVKLTFSDNSTCTACADSDIHIYGSPTAAINPPQRLNPCSDKLLFYFTQNSQQSADKFPITRYIWTFGDGNTSTQLSPVHLFDTTGIYTISLTIIDAKGCRDLKQFTFAVSNISGLAAHFTTVTNAQCKKTILDFTNTTDTIGHQIDSFFWIFGDGTGDSSQKNWSNFSHTYTKPGDYFPKLIIKTKGCISIDSSKTTVFNISGSMKIKTPASACYTDIKTTGLYMKVDSAKAGFYYIWTFTEHNKPPATVQQPDATYLPSEPGAVEIHFKAFTGLVGCPSLDTCFVVNVYGPVARILLSGVPTHDYLAARPRPLADFQSKTCIDTVNFSTFQSLGTNTYTLNSYCGGDTVKIKYDSGKFCNGKPDISVSALQLKPTKTTTVTIDDSLEVPNVFYPGDPLPVNPYFPSSGQLNVHSFGPDSLINMHKPVQMHDSDLESCSPYNLVFFTNYSVKYRGWVATDDQYPNLNPDTCLDHNYPYASDSLSYLWRFNDPTGKPCTSTYQQKDWECNYSTEGVPYHYYKDTKPPEGGCYEPWLIVTDTWKDKKGITHSCEDSTFIKLTAAPPNAGWDTTRFCKMTWDLQQSLADDKDKKGFRLLSNPLASCWEYHSHIDLTETMPECYNDDYLIEFDSAKHRKPLCTYSTYDTAQGKFIEDTVYGYNWISSKLLHAAPYYGSWFYNSKSDTNCKTIGVIKKNGNCTDTVWYHDYVCPRKVYPAFCAYDGGNNIGCSPDKIARTCPKNMGHSPSKVQLLPMRRDQKYLTTYSYLVARQAVPAGDAYYNKPVWPDTASLVKQFDTYLDEIKVYKDTFYLPANKTLLAHFNNRAGKKDSAFIANMYLDKKEVAALNSGKSITISQSDYRFRKVDLDCGGGAVSLSVPKALRPMAIAKTIKTLDMGSPKDSVGFTLPLPGMYDVYATVTDIFGCSAVEKLVIINGHYAKIWANDTVICLGTPTRFYQKTRYWTINAIGDVLNEKLNAWDVNKGDSLRLALNPNWVQSPGYYDEPMPEWDFGDGSPKVKAFSPTHTYNSPGVYTITMYTEDSNHCKIATVYRNFIKVIRVTADFIVQPLSDTATFCAPKLIKYKDATTLEMTKYSKGRYARYIDRVVKTFPPKPPAHPSSYDSIVVDTIIVDSIKSWLWSPGDGRPPIFRTRTDSVVFEYVNNGKYDVSLQVKTANCTDGNIKNEYINIQGPRPEFIPLDTVGCAPLTVKIKLKYTRARTYNWIKGDGSFETDNRDSAKDSIVYLTYKNPGKFALVLSANDSVYDFYTQSWIDCTSFWPDSVKNPYLPRFHITVYPRSPVGIKSRDTICVDRPFDAFPIADSNYIRFEWDMGNGTTYTDTLPNKVTTTYKNLGVYKLKLRAYTAHCSSYFEKNIYVIDVKAAFDTIRTGLASFAFPNHSRNGVQFYWDFGDNSKILPLTDTTTALHDFSNALPNDGDSSRANIDSFVFKVCLTAVNAGGCLDDTCRYVTVHRVWQPYNVFTPNGDGYNDKFWLKINGDTYYHLKIFNRWGEMVFESHDKNTNWDGINMATHQPCPEGTYFYVWDFSVVGLPRYQKIGSVTIIR